MQLVKRGLKKISERGVKYCVRKTVRYSLDKVRWMLDANYDRVHGVKTSGQVDHEDLRTDSGSVAEATWYEPVPEVAFRKVMRELDIGFENFTFVDFGSGMGRALFMASDYPFREIIGVEFAPMLHKIAAENITKYRGRNQTCRKITSVCADATEYALPPEPLVLFFYSPFKATILRKVLDNIIASGRAVPRPLVIVYVGLLPENLELLRGCGLQCREFELGKDFIRWERKKGMILTNDRVSEAGMRVDAAK
jgi:hypothetical protein